MDTVIVDLNTDLLDLDDFRNEHSVCSAHLVVQAIRIHTLRGDEWDYEYQKQKQKDTLALLKSWGPCMVNVIPFGVTHGRYLIHPYMIEPEQYWFLKSHEDEY